MAVSQRRKGCLKSSYALHAESIQICPFYHEEIKRDSFFLKYLASDVSINPLPII
jgi:hypothetical protein